MTDYSVDMSEDLVRELEESFQQGPIIEHEGRELRLLNEQAVARLGGVKVEVFSNEHPPPHFRVRYQGSTANYTIKDCDRLNGSGEVVKYEKNVRAWWKDNKEKLIQTWNELRPTDCPVGDYRE